MMCELQSLTEDNRIWRRGSHWLLARRSTRGQSLVEIAIVAPLLILMFIGVLEVGWALRGYLVLINVDREATRFAARGNYLNFSEPDIGDVGYQYVLTHSMDSLADQLPLDFISDNPNATMIITHLEIDTGYPCDNNQAGNPPCNDSCTNPPCDCTAPDKREPVYTADDRIILPPPALVGYSEAVSVSNTFRAEYGIGEPAHVTRIDDALWEELREQNNVINCQLMAKDPDISPSANSVVIVEIFYDQPQLLGVPLISNRFSDPIPMYVNTMMRIAASRQR